MQAMINFMKPFCLLILLFSLSGKSSGQLSQDSTKFLGNVGEGTLSDEFLGLWNQVTPENAGKWLSVEAERDVMNWKNMDSIYQSAKAHGLPVKFHTLVWGQQQPTWINSLSKTEQKEEVEEWFQLVAARYPDLEMIDVVNEPLHHLPPYKEAIGGNGTTGWDWLIWSFKKARQYFPKAKLLINDYDILNNFNNTVQPYRKIITLLKDSNLIDGIGLQGHFLENYTVQTITKNLESIASLGLPIYIAEFDLDIADDEAQKTKYASVFPVLWEHPQVKGITLWGYKQGNIWRTNAYLRRFDLSNRPAMSWLISYLNNGKHVGVTKLNLIEEKITLFSGQLCNPTYLVEPANASVNTVTWNPANPEIIGTWTTANSFVGLQSGSSYLYCTSLDNGLKDSVLIEVSEPAPSPDGWFEDFKDCENGKKLKTEGTTWSTAGNATGTFSVQDRRFTANNTKSEVAWLSGIVPISGSASISLKLQSGGGLETTDYIKVYYITSSGEKVLLSSKAGKFNGDLPLLAAKNGIQTESIQLLIVALNTNENEFYYFDEVKISSVATDVPEILIDNGFSAYPNPVKDLLTVQLTDADIPAQISFYDSSGKCILKKEQSFPQAQYKINELTNSGILYIHVVTDKKSMTGKVCRF
jgi:endo-1,4-beta-xylanase